MEKKSKSLFSIKEDIEEVKPSTTQEENIFTKDKEFSPFDMLNAIFKYSNDEWKKISNTQKAKNFFIVNRILSRGYPTMAQALNWNTIQTDMAIDLWRKYLKTKSAPSWIYQKSVSEKQAIKKTIKISEESMIALSKAYNCANKELSYFSELYPDIFQEEIKKIETHLKNK